MILLRQKIYSKAVTKAANKAIRKKLGYAKESPLKSRTLLNRKDPYFGGGFNRDFKNVDLVDELNMGRRGKSLHDKRNLKGNVESLWGRKDFEGLMKVNGKRVSGGLNKDAEGLEAVRDLARRSVKRN
jgi:hypothetical protein